MNKASFNKTQKSLDITYNLLTKTADWLVDLINKKVVQLETLKKQIEGGDESKREEMELAIKELNGLNNKMEFEKREIDKFETRVEEFENNNQENFIQHLSKQLLNFNKPEKPKSKTKKTKNVKPKSRKKSK